MFLRNRLLYFVTILVLAAIGLGVNGSQNEVPFPEIILEVGDTNAYPGEVVKVPVYLSNLFDTIAGFNFWVQLDRPDIMEFSTVVGVYFDTTWWVCTEWSGPDCIDSIVVQPDGAWDFYHVDTVETLIGTIDTTGTLVADWEYVGARSLSGFGTDLNVVGIADLPTPPITPGIYPQQGAIMIKLVGQIFDIPDSMTDRTVNIMVQTQFLDHFNFSDPMGNSLGIACDSIPDTTFFLCTNWAGEVCLNWQQVPGPPYDSIEVTWNTNCYVDTNVVQVLDGSVTVLLPILYGDADCSGSPDISDLVYMVDYMFAGGPPMPCLRNVDCDFDELITIIDLVCLVEWMFPQP
jgi:hypothetical protein